MKRRCFLTVLMLGILIIFPPSSLPGNSGISKPDRPEADPPDEKSGTVMEVLRQNGISEENEAATVDEDLHPDTVGVASVVKGLDRSFAIEDMRLEVNIGKRELYVFSGREKIATYPVAVGKPEWPTRPGRWGIYEVVWNPWWHPPDEEWAWYRAIMAPGDPDNPLGRAQLIYDAPRSIHGTIEPASIGRAVSHGSIRVTNEVAMKLARHVMESVGIVYDEEWYSEVQNDRSRNVRIRLSQRVPIRVYN